MPFGGQTEPHQTHQIRSSQPFQEITQISPPAQNRPLNPISKIPDNLRRLPREQATMLIQLRTGHIPLRKHLHRIGRISSPMCPTCPSQRETVHHLLMTCPAYTEERRQLESSIGRSSKSMKTLLTNPKTFPHLFRYISTTRRFNNDVFTLNPLASSNRPQTGTHTQTDLRAVEYPTHSA